METSSETKHHHIDDLNTLRRHPDRRLRRPREARRRDAVPGERPAGAERPARADARGGRALLSFRRGQPDQRPGPRPDRGAAARARPPRHRPADLLGQPELAPDARRHARAMAAAGVKRALGLVLAAYSSYSSCRQYREDIDAAQRRGRRRTPRRSTRSGSSTTIPTSSPPTPTRRRGPRADPAPSAATRPDLAFTAHSIPQLDGRQLRATRRSSRETCRLVAEALGVAPDRWQLVYQSRSGRPTDPWLEPDILDHLATLHAAGRARRRRPPGRLPLRPHGSALRPRRGGPARRPTTLGLNMVRSATVGTHPRFVAMLRELIRERLDPPRGAPAVGRLPREPRRLPADCCLPPARPHRRRTRDGEQPAPT